MPDVRHGRREERDVIAATGLLIDAALDRVVTSKLAGFLKSDHQAVVKAHRSEYRVVPFRPVGVR